MQRIYLDDFINFPVTKFKKGKQKNLVLHLDFRSKQICYGSKATPKRIIPFSILSSITVSADATKRFHLHLHDAPPYVFSSLLSLFGPVLITILTVLYYTPFGGEIFFKSRQSLRS